MAQPSSSLSLPTMIDTDIMNPGDMINSIDNMGMLESRNHNNSCMIFSEIPSIREDKLVEAPSNICDLDDGKASCAEILPSIGMKFTSYEDALNFYNEYAKKKGFGTKIKSSWRDTKSNELNHALFTCRKQGLKKNTNHVHFTRPNIRVGCTAQMRIKLTSSKKWKVVDVELEHNHLCSPSKSRRFRSHKHLNAGGHKNLTFGEKEARNHVEAYRRLKLGEGDAQAMHTYFTQMQKLNSNFFYLLDLDDEGRLRNVFWVDVRARAAYRYFGDVVTFDTTYLTNKHNLKFAPFKGVNHHGQSVLLGCGLLSDELTKSFIWIFKAWLTAMSNIYPNAIITDQCKAMANAIHEVFPEANHRLCLWHIMKKISEKLGSLKEYKAIKKEMKTIVYDSLRIIEFEAAWEKMINEYVLENNTWLKTLYELRHKWIPVYLKDTFFAGMSTTQRSESMNAFSDGYVHSKTSLKEFVEQYDFALRDKYEKKLKLIMNLLTHLHI